MIFTASVWDILDIPSYLPRQDNGEFPYYHYHRVSLQTQYRFPSHMIIDVKSCPSLAVTCITYAEFTTLTDARRGKQPLLLFFTIL
jgi:hypothetical protein